MIQCTKTVFNQYKWPSSNFWRLCWCAGVCNDINYSYRTAGWRPVQFCNKTQDLQHGVKVDGDLSALKVTTGENSSGDLNFLMQTFLSALHFKRYRIHILTFMIWLCLRHTMSNNQLKSFFRFDEFVVTYIIDDLVYEF